MSGVVHRMVSSTLARALCGRPTTDRMLLAVLKTGPGYRWCKQCQKAKKKGKA